MTIIASNVTVSFAGLELSGDIDFDAVHNTLSFDDRQWPSERIDTDLFAHGVVSSEPGTVFIKDVTEHEGLTASLVEAGVVRIVREVSFGPFQSKAYEVRPIDAVEAFFALMATATVASV
jgi:hypothetical protein